MGNAADLLMKIPALIGVKYWLVSEGGELREKTIRSLDLDEMRDGSVEFEIDNAVYDDADFYFDEAEAKRVSRERLIAFHEGVISEHKGHLDALIIAAQKEEK